MGHSNRTMWQSESVENEILDVPSWQIMHFIDFWLNITYTLLKIFTLLSFFDHNVTQEKHNNLLNTFWNRYFIELSKMVPNISVPWILSDLSNFKVLLYKQHSYIKNKDLNFNFNLWNITKLGRNLCKMALNCPILKILVAKTIYITWRILKNGL